MKSRYLVLMLLPALLVLVISGCGKKVQVNQWTTVIEGETLLVPSLTGGIIKELRTKEGDWVQAGDTLALLDTRELLYQIEQIDASLSEIEIQSRIATTNIAQAQQDLQWTSDRTERLRAVYKAQGMALQDVENADNLLEKSKSAAANIAAQHQILQASQNKLLAQKKILRKKIADTVITASAAGLVSTLYFHTGEAIPPFGNVLELIDISNVTAKIYVSEAALGKLKVGEKVRVKTITGIVLEGDITHISDKAEFTPKTILTPDTRSAMVYAVKISIANPDKSLKIGMPVDITL